MNGTKLVLMVKQRNNFILDINMLTENLNIKNLIIIEKVNKGYIIKEAESGFVDSPQKIVRGGQRIERHKDEDAGE